jgi:tryptophanyl-tRNA synthetase
VPRLPGIDGNAKMSKSLGNAITLGASPDEIRAAVRRIYTNPRHMRVQDPGSVEGNVVFAFLDAFEIDRERVEELKTRYRHGGLSDSMLKKRLEERLHSLIAPTRDRRAWYAGDRAGVLAMLRQGTERARASGPPPRWAPLSARSDSSISTEKLPSGWLDTRPGHEFHHPCRVAAC